MRIPRQDPKPPGATSAQMILRQLRIRAQPVSDPQDTKASHNPKEDDADARAAALAMFCAPKDQDLMTFGKCKGHTYQSVIDEAVDYVKWILEHCSEQSSSGMRRFKDWLLAKAAAAAS